MQIMALLSSAILLLTIFPATIESAGGCYTSLIGFGDSLTDTGNAILGSPPDINLFMGSPPYGETYFHRPTGRCCDGRIIIDFIAEYFELPFVPPSAAVVKRENMTADDFFTSGANFAFAGSPSLDTEFYMARGIYNDCTNISLLNQIHEFKAILSSLCKAPPGCKRELERSLVLLGSFGGNDYAQPFYAGKSIDYVLPFVPLVAEAIAFATAQLIEIGVRTIIVPGILPSGCLPSLLARFETTNKAEYDSNGCHIQLNKLSIYHNQMLQEELQRIRLRYPHAQVIYADYYNSAIQIYNNPRKYGFSAWPLGACCGSGGTYNYNLSLGMCGQPSAKVCDNASLYVAWDGPHMTEAAYKVIFEGLTQGPYSIPPIANSCLISDGVSVRGLSSKLLLSS